MLFSVPARRLSSAARDGQLTHTDAAGKASMVDIGGKVPSARTASASGTVHVGPAVCALVQANQMQKGDVLTVAQLAGILGAKHTATLIPLCHPLPLSHIAVTCRVDPAAHAIAISATVSTVHGTGVEMEALTAVAVAALTVYDMCKAASREMVIGSIRLDSKTGGARGDYVRSA